MIDNQSIYDENWQSWIDMKTYGPASRWLRHLIKKQITGIDVGRVNTVLDVGCGEGSTTDFLARNMPNAQVLGVDFSETGINCAKRAFNLKNLSFKHDPDNNKLKADYDMVTSFEVLEHVDDWQTTLEAMATASRQYLLLSTPTGRMRAFEAHVGHVRNFKKAEIELFLERRGFATVCAMYAGFPFYSPFYRDICNLTDAGANQFTRGSYDWKQKAVASILYSLFKYASTTYSLGDQFCGLFRRR